MSAALNMHPVPASNFVWLLQTCPSSVMCCSTVHWPLCLHIPCSEDAAGPVWLVGRLGPHVSGTWPLAHVCGQHLQTRLASCCTSPNCAPAAAAGAVWDAEYAGPAFDCWNYCGPLWPAAAAVLVRKPGSAGHAVHHQYHCGLLQVLSEKLDVLRLAFYTAPISCSVLLPLFIVREVKCCLLHGRPARVAACAVVLWRRYPVMWGPAKQGAACVYDGCAGGPLDMSVGSATSGEATN